VSDTRTEFLERLKAAVGDRYAIEREIGRGGTAIVYLAQDRKHGRQVALKVLRPEVTAALGGERFLREIQISARLAHPNILPLHDSGEADGFLYYVMPFVSGESLRERLRRERELPVEEATRIAREVAGALSYAHRQGVVHRDIKPENILLEDGHAVVADFGLARSLFAATSVTGSTSGLAIGTPAYMSPEQWSADPDVDGRSDLYSLGCVVYEMLAGEPPFAGPSAQAISARHRLDTPRSLRITRPGVSPSLDRVVGRLLPKTPADRYQSAADVTEALDHPDGPAPRSRAKELAIAVVLLTAVIAGLLLYRTRAVSVDPERYLILPFRHRGDAAPALVNGDVCEAEIYEALARWNDIRVVNSFIARDALTRRGGANSLPDAMSVAQRLGAGRLLWGELWESGDTTYVRGTVYDVTRRGVPLVEHTIRLRPGQVGSSFTELADSLVLAIGGALPPREGGTGTQSFAALRAYGEASAAIGRWDLSRATGKLREALTLDSRYPQASLRLAQVSQWQDLTPAEWRAFAVNALASGGLSSRDSAVGLALIDLADSRFPEACDRYRSMLSRDSLDFSAWYGLGECQSRDDVVVSDRTSPSGWRFRSSQWSAITAFRRALELVPSVHVAFQGAALLRLEEILYTEPGWLREGRALRADSLRFACFPSLVADTLGFLPWPAEEVMSGRPRAISATREQAVDRSRGILRDIGTTWIQAYPRSPAALRTYILAVERTGDLEARPPVGVPMALDAARTLRATAITAEERLATGVFEVRLLLKTGRFAPAAALADSLLASPDADSSGAAPHVAGLAALRGRVDRAAAALERTAAIRIATGPGGERPELPDAVKAASLRLLAYAAFGGPRDSLLAAAENARRVIGTYVASSARQGATEAVFARPVALAWPALDTLSIVGDYLLDLERALQRGDRAEAGRQLGAINAIRANQRPGDVAIDATLAEVRALLAFGDTTAATDRLTRILDALPTLNSDLLTEVSQAAALVRAMALRADLARTAGDSVSALRWARAVVSLWSGGDGDTPAVVSRLRGISSRN
jgi:tRNA A-37 threonylcarbamoyl transferase component Bud32/tetratricopeptide (TPR) repeat protein